MLKLTGKNLELYAAKHYKNHRCVDYEEFKDDLARFKYVKRLLRRYTKTDEIDARLVLNHIILIYNVFHIEGANQIFAEKIDPIELPSLKAFLSFMNFLPDSLFANVSPDINIVTKLQRL
jgi:hypothetical protein